MANKEPWLVIDEEARELLALLEKIANCLVDIDQRLAAIERECLYKARG